MHSVSIIKMSFIVKSVQIAHILGVLIIASVFVYNYSVKSEFLPGLPHGTDQYDDGDESNNGALSVVAETSSTNDNGNNDEDDGVITDEENATPSNNEVDESLETFKPTDEWKTVLKGQKIPAGLHVRMNVQTGESEAKLMVQEPEEKIESWDAGDKFGIINTEKKRFTRDELKKALKDFKYNDEVPANKEHDEEVKKKFRSYEELKKEMKDMNMSMKSEAEIVTELEIELKQKDNSPDKLKILLQDLEYYLHQIDNARVFCDLGGLKTLVHLMNNTDEDIREAATLTLGSALQSNVKVQIAALETGVLQQLLRILSIDHSNVVRKRALFALSTLLRQFPYAQKRFVHSGGLSALMELFVSSKEDSLKLKIVTLLTDLFLEYDFNVNHPQTNDELQAKRTLQYKEVGLVESLPKSGWCVLMTSLLHSPSGHDSVEKVVTALLAFIPVCKDEFSSSRPKLQALLSEYKELAQTEIQEGSKDVFYSIYSTIQTLVQNIHRDDL